MPRFFTETLSGDRALLSGEDAAHISRSLRLRPGEEIDLCDGKGTDYHCRILSIGETVEVEILDRHPSETEPKVRLILYQACPKGDKMELIIQKAVELGAYAVVPVLTDRCISRPDGKSMAKKLVRYQKIAEEAAKQSGRGLIPEVRPLLTLKQAAESYEGKGIVFYEKGGERLNQLVTGDEEAISLFVGSEGGFAPEEIELLESKGVLTATLGKRILRCETAPLCGLSVVLSLTGDI
ncbi:MAG: 16S rRNA (uracil(1498)-N(3))-methyltransferase [Oscillospiraceae bacterium]|nr:16S rRNA (uracil(1498)-N(3))-methyltransferase [Oscillospiraceae bacterium]